MISLESQRWSFLIPFPLPHPTCGNQPSSALVPVTAHTPMAPPCPSPPCLVNSTCVNQSPPQVTLMQICHLVSGGILMKSQEARQHVLGLNSPSLSHQTSSSSRLKSERLPVTQANSLTSSINLHLSSSPYPASYFDVTLCSASS